MKNSSSSNIKVLIIIGSDLKREDKSQIPINYTHYASSLLLSKMFTEMLGLTPEDVMITCTVEKYFTAKYQVETITTPIYEVDDFPSFKKNQYLDIMVYTTSYIKTSPLYFPSTEKEDYTTYVDIQNMEYSFQIEPHIISETIKIFPYSLNQFKTNTQTELIVFLIDHGDTSSFGPYHFDKYITEINKLPCKHVHLFVDSCKSGTLIQMIHFSRFLAKMLQQTNDGPIDFSRTSRHRLLSILESLYNIEKNCLNQEKPSALFLDSMKNVLNQSFHKNLYPFKNVDIDTIRKNLPFFQILEEAKPGFIDYEQLYIFSQKSEVFCSSVGDLPSYFMPMRLVNKTPFTYYPGTIFLSACFEALFFTDVKQPLNQRTIISSIRNSINNSKDLFANILKSNSGGISTNNIDEFFNCFSQGSWFFLNTFDFPNLNAMRKKEAGEITKIRKVQFEEYRVPDKCCYILYPPIRTDDSSDSEQYWAKTIFAFNKEFPAVVSDLLKQNKFKPFSFIDYPIEPENFYPGTLKYYYKIKSKITNKIDSVYLNYLSESGSPFLSYIDQYKTDEIKKQVTKIFIQAFFELDKKWREEYLSRHKQFK